MSEKILKAAVITLAFLLLLLIFALGYLLTDDAATSPERHQASLGPIALRLADGSARITPTVICSSASVCKTIASSTEEIGHLVKARSAMHKAEDLSTLEGKNKLQADLRGWIKGVVASKAGDPSAVSDVFFEEIVTTVF